MRGNTENKRVREVIYSHWESIFVVAAVCCTIVEGERENYIKLYFTIFQKTFNILIAQTSYTTFIQYKLRHG